MSLTSHLADTKSPIRQFLVEQFPNASRVTQSCRNQLASATTIRPEGTLPWRTSGMALDYRIRYYFAPTSSRELVAWLGADNFGGGVPSYRGALSDLDTPAINRFTGEIVEEASPKGVIVQDFFDELDVQLTRLQPAGKRLDRQDEALLNRYCWGLALFDQVARTGVVYEPLLSVSSCEELMALPEKEWIDDLSQLSWSFYEHFHDQLSKPIVLNPIFSSSGQVGGADADLILDRCLVEIKSTINPRLDPMALIQLAGYLILDDKDGYGINAVAVYLARQGVFIRWPLNEFLDAMTGKQDASMTQIRDAFQQSRNRTSVKQSSLF